MNLHSVPNWADDARTKYTRLVSAAESGNHHEAEALQDGLRFLLVQATLAGAPYEDLRAIATLSAAAVFLPVERS